VSTASAVLQRRVLLGVLLGVLVYAGILLWADAGAVLASLRELSWWVVPGACALALANYLLRFLRWQRYLRRLEIDLPRGTSCLISLAGLSMSVTPGKLGEVFKSWLVRQVHGAPIHQTAPIVVAERVTDLLGYLVLIAAGGALSRPDYTWLLAAALGLCAAAVLSLGSRRVSRWTRHALKRTPYFWRLAERAEGAFASARRLLSPRLLLEATAIAVIGWGLECLAFWWIASELVPGSVGLQQAVFAFALSAVVGALALFAPGGLGVTEFSLGKLLRGHYSGAGLALAAAQQKAAAAVILARLCTLWFAVAVGLAALGLFSRRFGAPRAPADANATGLS
jgi:uncharacterized protein (TIRG00374 family)